MVNAAVFAVSFLRMTWQVVVVVMRSIYYLRPQSPHHVLRGKPVDAVVRAHDELLHVLDEISLAAHARV